MGRLTPNTNDYLFVAGISMTGLWLTWFLQGVASIIGKEYPEVKTASVSRMSEEVEFF